MSKINELAGFEATLTHNALVQPQINKLKAAGTPPEFYGLIAFPAEAQATLWDILVECAQAAHNMSEGFEHGIKTNAKQSKPIAGIASDDIVVRAATQFAPELYDSDGTLLNRENPAHLAIIQKKFYAGAKVRVVLTPFPWHYTKTNKRGVSLNLSGLMAVPGEPARRLAIGGADAGSAFAKHVQVGTGGTGGADPVTAPASTAAPAASANPFAQAAPSAPQASSNPFA